MHVFNEPQNNRLKTGGAFDAQSDQAFDLDCKLRGHVLGGYKVGQLLGAGDTEDDWPYLVIEYVDRSP